MAKARATLPHHMTTTRYMYNGPGAHVITYPVANNTILNTLVVVSDPKGAWTPPPSASGDDDSDGTCRHKKRARNPHVGSATREEATGAFEEWHHDIRTLVGLLPPEMDKWAIFDMLENPVPRYHGGGGSGSRNSESNSGSVTCLAGDAAHACGPHLGAGAGFGIEDALLLAELLRAVRDGHVDDSDGGGEETVGARLAAAFEVYSEVRHGRTQWLVKNTRDAVDLFQWEDPGTARSPLGFGYEIEWRFREIWHYDVGKMVEEARQKLEAR
jgi:salicylate hydroxylase